MLTIQKLYTHLKDTQKAKLSIYKQNENKRNNWRDKMKLGKRKSNNNHMNSEKKYGIIRNLFGATKKTYENHKIITKTHQRT